MLLKKKIQNSPPKDIFKIFERKADNHSTLVWLEINYEKRTWNINFGDYGE